MLVKDLRKALEDVDDNMQVLGGEGYDHSYTPITRAHVSDAEETKYEEYYEYFNGANMSEGSEKIQVFLIS